MRLFMIPIMLACLSPRFASAGQIIAGTAEDKMFQQITARNKPECEAANANGF